MNTTITDRLLYNLTSYQYCVSALQYCLNCWSERRKEHVAGCDMGSWI